MCREIRKLGDFGAKRARPFARSTFFFFLFLLSVSPCQLIGRISQLIDVSRMDRMEWLGHLQVTVSNHMIDGKNGQDLTLINHDRYDPKPVPASGHVRVGLGL